VFAPPRLAPFVFAKQGKIQLNPFASAKPSSGPTDALPSQIVKEQPIFQGSGIGDQESESVTAPLRGAPTSLIPVT
jgi:hypothetical protein